MPSTGLIRARCSFVAYKSGSKLPHSISGEALKYLECDGLQPLSDGARCRRMDLGAMHEGRANRAGV
jgi:hypothetical protein